MPRYSPVATIESACLIRGNFALLATSLDTLPQREWDFSRVSTFEPNDKINPWSYRDYDYTVVDVSFWQENNLRCILSREGDIRLYGPGGVPDRTYRLPDAGVMREEAAGYGYVNRIRAIGQSLYVCGQSRQVYRFAPSAAHVLDGVWKDFAGPMRQAPISEPPDDNGGEAFDRWLDENDAIDFMDIAGTSEDDIYAAGDECWHYDGLRWEQLQLPTDECINAIKAIDTDQIVMVGHNGTVLMGNARQGFKELSGIEDNQNFTGAEWFQGKLFLASNLGLYIYDPDTGKIEPYRTKLSPELQDAHILEAKDGVLWSFGFKDLAYFDGKAWMRVDHPDNPPIR